ncbi:MAG: sigma-70 family RNA polymerase sigma factor [Phycisphaerae bacterium]|nr:sigma-70 family RNA polymerase sigma factor [Phycisphaerae bacterium]
MEGSTDKTLVAAACGGDRQAYAELIRLYYKPVFLACLGILGKPCDAEDTAQSTFLKGFTQVRRLRDGAQFRAWIMRIARNESINLLRRRQHMERSADNLVSPCAGQEATHSIDLDRALARLPEPLRSPLVMYYLDGRSVPKVAEHLSMSASNVYQRLRTGLRQLHQLLVEQGDAR